MLKNHYILKQGQCELQQLFSVTGKDFHKCYLMHNNESQTDIDWVNLNYIFSPTFGNPDKQFPKQFS